MKKCVILLPFLISFGCAITYNIIGSRVFFLSCRNITFINTTDFICYKKIILRKILKGLLYENPI